MFVGLLLKALLLGKESGLSPPDLRLISGIILAFLNLRVSTIFISALVLCFVAVVVVQRK